MGRWVRPDKLTDMRELTDYITTSADYKQDSEKEKEIQQ